MTPSPASLSPPNPPAARRSRTRWFLGAGVAIVAALGGAVPLFDLSASGATPKPAAPVAAALPPAVPVSVAVVERRDAAIWSDFSGRLEAVERVEVRPRVAGAIVRANFREGALVKAGDPLFAIDRAPYVAAVEGAEAQVAAARSRLDLATKEQQRSRILVGSNAVSQRELDQRVAEFQAAEANLRVATAALDTARLDLDWTEVRAPIGGRVGRIEVSAGNLVGAGAAAPVLATLVSVDPIRAVFDADEGALAAALAGLPAGVDFSTEIGRIPVEMTTQAAGAPVRRGRLQLVDNVVDLRSGTVRLRAVFDNPDGRLMPGQFARLRLGRAAPEPVIAIDEKAVGTDQDRRFVMVVGDDDTVAYRRVRLGATVEGRTLVTDGLTPGERIVVDGLQRIRPGAKVAPRAVAVATSDTTTR
ncbi:efflux RND transporter periplasmic adaptor subunit [Siculibacillus lacustris]|uniref:Efflux RND transporter periplasmic adaptor subunit n=1 Tax=Siculibacillus lacustris TaxID=1549641 RepID=A0A4Q9VJ60_9HYPH|nr:efflux RND transporter periplasmic adaptor subunit [Siculibacillus lacustris]TBW34845.1 efflux RND transporter periplasmic adaptor subunit [Siculibacillus lacustris]